MKEKVLRDTRIRSMHEMGELTRAQELQVDEVSGRKLREDHETIQKLTSQLQSLQEQMNSMNDSGEFQDAESNFSTCENSKFSFHAEPRQTPASEYMEFIWIT